MRQGVIFALAMAGLSGSLDGGLRAEEALGWLAAVADPKGDPDSAVRKAAAATLASLAQHLASRPLITPRQPETGSPVISFRK